MPSTAVAIAPMTTDARLPSMCTSSSPPLYTFLVAQVEALREHCGSAEVLLRQLGTSGGSSDAVDAGADASSTALGAAALEGPLSRRLAGVGSALAGRLRREAAELLTALRWPPPLAEAEAGVEAGAGPGPEFTKAAGAPAGDGDGAFAGFEAHPVLARRLVGAEGVCKLGCGSVWTRLRACGHYSFCKDTIPGFRSLPAPAGGRSDCAHALPDGGGAAARLPEAAGGAAGARAGGLADPHCGMRWRWRNALASRGRLGLGRQDTRHCKWCA